MTDHKVFISALPKERLFALNELSNGPGLWHLAGHATLIFLLGLWIAFGLPLWALALPLQGVAICFLFTLEHEATHKTPFKTPWLNEWVGCICGVLLCLPFEWFRYFHLAHHRYTNIPEKDPELGPEGKPNTWGGYIVHVSGVSYWIDMIDKTIGNAFGRHPGDFVPERARLRVKTEARWMLIIYLLALSSLFLTPLLFWIWILPCLLGQPFLRLYLLAEHGRCAFVANMFENTRTTFTNRIVRFLAWNMPYHTEHHTLPQVPFHHLPDLHREMRAHLTVISPGYGVFTVEYARNLG